MPDIHLKLTRAANAAHFHVPAQSTVRIDLEAEYLPSVVSSEVYESNSRTPLEAKKAQAVAARCYALACAKAGAVMDDTPKYQSFTWRDPSTIPESVKAVRETAGQTLRSGGAVITAWFCQSNGGMCKRSDEVWSAYKPWTARQSDPWDEGGRRKWGERKPSHGVGLSQTGAAYAAYMGVSYHKILSFYYPNTVLTDADGVPVAHQAARDGHEGHEGHDGQNARDGQSAHDGRSAHDGHGILYRAKVAYVNKALNLRATPDLGDNTLVMLRKGALVDVIADRQGEAGAFALIRHQGGEGYCSTAYLARVEA